MSGRIRASGHCTRTAPDSYRDRVLPSPKVSPDAVRLSDLGGSSRVRDRGGARSVRRGWTLGQLSWRLGISGQRTANADRRLVAATTALAAAQARPDEAGRTGGAASTGWPLGLAVVLWRGVRAGPIVARALADGLGSGWHAELPPEVTARLARHRPRARLLFTPMAVRRHDVVRLADLAYGPAGRQNLLDVYRPRSGEMTGPCLVYFHGGGYSSGRKNREARALVYRLASQGWLCVSANYRLARSAPLSRITRGREAGHRLGA